MRCEVVPSEVLDVISLEPSTFSKSIPDEIQTSTGNISKNGLWLWLIRGPVVEIYRTEGKEKRGGYCCKDSSRNPLFITASAELQSSHVSFPCLLIALDVDPDGSLLCMFDANALRIVRALKLPYRVTSIEVISGDGGVCMETHQLNPHLRCLFGLVAVGTESGHIFLVDLCLDEEYNSDIDAPGKSIYVNKQSLSAKRREVAILKQQHICMFLNDNSFSGDSFEFRSYSSLITRYPSDDVFVSSLKYVRSLATIAVGFNFDGVQLWNLQFITLQYTIENPAYSLPVVSFAFQEPENDPRHFCYLWVIRGHCEQERPEHTSIATLYSLSYHKREWIDSYGPFYTELQSCQMRFEYPLTTDPFLTSQQSSSFSSRLVSCQVMSHGEALNFFRDTPASHSESDCSAEELSLCFIAWETYATNGDSLSACYLLLFDINQWYQAQMPSFFRCDPSQLNSYLGVYSLLRVSQQLNMKSLLGIYAIPNSLKKIKCLNATEEFFYPSSHGFQMWCFSSSCLALATFFGFQRQLLFELMDDGPKYLSNPKEILTLFLISGLLSDMHSAHDRNISLTQQRETLLQLALETHLPNFFMKCMQDLRFGDMQDGYSTRTFLSWGWKKIISIKGSIDKLSQPLFNCSGLDIDKASLNMLHSYKKQLDLIYSIHVGYEKYAMPRTDQESQELIVKKHVVSSINIYLQVLLWLHSTSILPETCVGEDMKDTIVYPVNSIMQLYSTLRSQLQKIHSSISATDLLLVDGLVKEACIGYIWQEKGGLETYPPPSIYAALSLYLIDGITLTQKHMLMYYILLDITSSLPDLTPQLKMFLPVFDISRSISKLTKAFWYLDHQDFESAIKKFLKPGLKAGDILPWQHRRIIKSFLFQGEAHKALRYINHIRPPESSVEDKKLHLSVLLARRLISRAFDYQREMQISADAEEMFNHFLLGCQETRSLKVLMYLPLNSFEISTLVKFLYENEDPRAQETLVMYHLLRYNFFDAARVNDKLLSVSKEKGRASFRNALVGSFLDTVSKAERNLADELTRMPVESSKIESFPQPLSVSVTSCSLKQVSYSDLLNSILSQVSCGVQNSNSRPQTPLKPRLESCFDSVPFLRPTTTPEAKRRHSDVFTTPLSKRNVSHAAGDSTSPVKRTKLLDPSFKIKDSSFKEKTPKHLARDVASLLQTPPIHRRTSQVFHKGSLPNVMTETPQSILKKKFSRSSVTDEVNIYNARTPSVCSLEYDSDSDFPTDIDKVFEESRPNVENHSRQIRFQVPSPVMISPEQATSFSPELSKANPDKIDFSMNFPSPFLPKMAPLNRTITPSRSTEKQHQQPTHKTCAVLINTPSLHAQTKWSTPVGANPIPTRKEESFMVLPCGVAESEAVEDNYQVEPNKSLSLESPVDQQLSFDESHFSVPVASSRMLLEKFSTPSTFPVWTGESFTILSRGPNRTESDCGEESLSVQHGGMVSSLKFSKSVREQSFLSFSESHFATPAVAQLQKVNVSRQDSFSGSSNYSSASERSFKVSPRRPLRNESKVEIIDLCENESINTQNATKQSSFVVKTSISDHDYKSPPIQVQEQTDSAQRCRERFDLMSKNSDLYEVKKILTATDRLCEMSNKLYKENEEPRIKAERKFVFGRENNPLQKNIAETNSDEEVIVFSTKSKFLQECEDETYEDFSQSLKGGTPMETLGSKSKSIPAKMTTESSPVFYDEVQMARTGSKTIYSGKATKKDDGFLIPQTTDMKAMTVRKKHSTSTQSSKKSKKSSESLTLSSKEESLNKTTRSRKNRVTQKLEFSFSEPLSPAGPEILEALSSPPERPVLPFVFSPPATRARVRQKKLDDTMGSSFASFMSDTSFPGQRKPPAVDPLLCEIIQQSSLDINRSGNRSMSYQRQKSSAKKTSVRKSVSRRCVVNLISPLPVRPDEPNAETGAHQMSSRHSMVLRQTVKKRKSVKLFNF